MGNEKKNIDGDCLYKKDLPEISIEASDTDYTEPFVKEFPTAPVITAGKFGKDQMHTVRGNDPRTVGEVKGELAFRNPKRKGSMGPVRITRQKSYFMKDGKKIPLSKEKIISTKRIKRETKGK